jgi:predicted dehydrogenase
MEAGLHGDRSMLKVLVVGYGSVGRRHVANLTRIGGIDEVFVYTKMAGNGDSNVEKKITFLDASNTTMNEACKQARADFAIIANQTYKHIDTALVLAENGLHLFIEKPLSHNKERINVLKEVVQSMQLKVFVAYNLRFLPAIQLIKNQLSQKAIGELYFARIEAGRYLPSWRTSIAYQVCYSAREEFGGGVHLDLSHEVDYMRYLFGDPYNWKTMKSKVSDFEISSKDIFEGLYEYHNGFICNVHMDYLQRKPMRQIRILGSRGSIVCDLVNKWMELRSDESECRFTEERFFKIEDTYVDELRIFMECINSNKYPNITIVDGERVLELLEDYHDL